MKQDAIILSIGVLIMVTIITISDVDLSGKTIYRQPEIIWHEGEKIFCNKYECEDYCGRPCHEYINKHESDICSHRIYYNWRTDESWYMYYKCGYIVD